jgi:DNA-binding transcriptional ArsR family regulator
MSDLLDPEVAAQGFAAAGSDSRLRVLRVLVRAGIDGLTISDIQQRTEIAASTLAHHLRFLTSGGLITQQKEGRNVVNRADYQRIQALAEFLITECCADAKTECCVDTAQALGVNLDE